MPKRPPASLSTKLGAIGALLLLLALGSIGLTLWVTWQLEGGAAAVNEAGRLRMQTWRIAQGLDAGDAPGRQAQFAQFERSLALLEAGDPARPLFVPTSQATDEAFAQVRSQWVALRAQWDRSPPPGAAVAASQAEALVARIDAFVGAIEVQLARWTAVLTWFQLGLMGLALAGGVTLLYAAYLFVFSPLARLQAGLARVERGDLAARVAVDSQDEFGRLAEGFNRMASTLQDFYRNLEHKVQDKTESLRAERVRLTLLYEASAFVARAPSLQALAQGFAQRLRSAARADAALLRWYDAERRQHVLLASDCLPAEMLEQERCLAEGDCRCGDSSAPPGARVIPLHPVGAAAASPCERFGFTRVLSVPVRLHDKTLGEADLLYRGEPRELEAPERALVESLASHLASGMEGLRATALEREAAVAEERGLLARELHDSIAQGLAFLKIQLQLLRGAQRRGDAGAAARALDELDAGLRESTADVRELLLNFRTRTTDENIVPALQTTLHKFQLQTGLPAHLQVHGAGGVPLAPDVQVQLLHVVQEALSNVRKHAQAGAVWVDVQTQPRWRIEVRDDGRGFAADTHAPDETHVGLRIMRERAAGIGAQVQVESVPGQGTRVAVALPEPALAA
jgi:two-component system nitrate/nitrite sensor histidine kinase NarX